MSQLASLPKPERLRGSSCSSASSMSQFVVQVDGQEWDLSNLVSSGSGDAADPPPPPDQLEQPNNSSSSDDSSVTSETMMALVSPSPPHPRQRKQGPLRQSSLTCFSAEVYYPKPDEVMHDQGECQHARRRTRHEMEAIATSRLLSSRVVEEEDEDDDDDVFMGMDNHDVFESIEPQQQQQQGLSNVMRNGVYPNRIASFDDCSSLSSNSAMVTTVTSPARLGAPQSTNAPTTWIEVMPQQFLPLVGDSYATWQAITTNNVHQVSCAICHTQQYCMTTISTVFCAACRSLFPNVHFVSGPGGLGLGMPMEDAHHELKRRNVKRPQVTAPPTQRAPPSQSRHVSAWDQQSIQQQQQLDDLASHWTPRSCGSATGKNANASFHSRAAATTTPH